MHRNPIPFLPLTVDRHKQYPPPPVETCATSLATAAMALLLAAGSPAWADGAPDPATLLPDVVVTATRIPTPAADVASSISLITADDIARNQYRTLPDALRSVPGLDVIQSGGPGGVASVFMRGTNSNHTKVLIDGAEANDPSSPTGAFDFSQIQTEDIARIEVLRGPQAALYGSDTIGGVINVITRRGEGPPKVRVSLEGGSFDTFNQSAGVGGSAGRLTYDVSVAHQRVGAVDVTPRFLVPPGRPVNPDVYDNRTYATRLGYKLTDTLEAGLAVRYVDTSLRSTSDDFLGPEGARTDSVNHELFTRATLHQSAFDGRFDQTFGVGFTDYRRRILDTAQLAASPSYFRGNRLKFDWQGNVRVTETQVVTLGAEHLRDELDNSIPVRAHQTDTAGFVQLQSSFGDRFFNTASARYDSYSTFGSRATYRLAPALLFPETGTKIKATVGTGFKAPTLDELYDAYPSFGFFGNPNLKPETSTGYDGGFEQDLFGKRIGFGATYFHNSIRNLIAVNDSFTSYSNVGRASTHGVETYVRYAPADAVSVRADYTYTIARDDDLHQELLRRPKHKASVTGTWQIGEAAQVSATVLYVGPWVDFNRSGSQAGLRTPGYVTVNVAASYDIGHGVTAFARIDNLLDRHYQEPLGFLRPGIGVFAGLKGAFDARQFGL